MLSICRIVQNIRGPKLLWLLPEPQMYSQKLQGVLGLMDIVLMQTQKFFREDAYGDLTMKVLSLESFVVYCKAFSIMMFL